jgi:hypothetical protein
MQPDLCNLVQPGLFRGPAGLRACSARCHSLCIRIPMLAYNHGKPGTQLYCSNEEIIVLESTKQGCVSILNGGGVIDLHCRRQQASYCLVAVHVVVVPCSLSSDFVVIIFPSADTVM